MLVGTSRQRCRFTDREIARMCHWERKRRLLSGQIPLVWEAKPLKLANVEPETVARRLLGVDVWPTVEREDSNQEWSLTKLGKLGGGELSLTLDSNIVFQKIEPVIRAIFAQVEQQWKHEKHTFVRSWVQQNAKQVAVGTLVETAQELSDACAVEVMRKVREQLAVIEVPDCEAEEVQKLRELLPQRLSLISLVHRAERMDREERSAVERRAREDFRSGAPFLARTKLLNRKVVQVLKPQGGAAIPCTPEDSASITARAAHSWGRPPRYGGSGLDGVRGSGDASAATHVGDHTGIIPTRRNGMVMATADNLTLQLDRLPQQQRRICTAKVHRAPGGECHAWLALADCIPALSVSVEGRNPRTLRLVLGWSALVASTCAALQVYAPS